jgi:hypothetical protein
MLQAAWKQSQVKGTYPVRCHFLARNAKAAPAASTMTGTGTPLFTGWGSGGLGAWVSCAVLLLAGPSTEPSLKCASELLALQDTAGCRVLLAQVC